ncbi:MULTISPECIES: DNA ligase D [unclassified Rhizobium]|uniref:DNA ligase D n=1 Tax=unclassified Rhizobium TaxID=2613769 RepID=UPI00161231B4|nr:MULTISPECIES: DNA ligase D [unclassified Rhizobium]MBB3285319.1 bifunctional non-homologous end joining protein LigD [Rhizobium sp. BK252]MBB3400058.1 bifunctional non-homologous end joining protein LigD [Rhizobium sp. BK289]MBB3412638.1 bifunctional non-homologous end joining protein LigD [Rhizobium sp. BK284]MBB3480524.1 bifunctional non-homologous end joining protein LigD [Rhizobium sp. BK347]MDK4719189.1 DNA ligase D [Rhizobium sp. CNPSo 3968]
MVLETYNRKRDFTKTTEPKGRANQEKRRASGDSFVIQKHDARRLHYDFRLELDGVLKSWAVTKGPSLVPGEKRLAVQTEDHPLEYGDFEGTIPKGEYGGGTVLVWDKGSWTPLGDPHKGLNKGHLEFELHGKKLGGRWHLIRMAGKPREKRENWLLIKGEDDAARPEGAPDILEERPESAKTGRVIHDVEGEKPGWSSKTGKIDRSRANGATREKPHKAEPEADAKAIDPSSLKGARKAHLPTFIEPALATLVAKPPSGARWLHEIKFDGYRLEVRIEAGRIKLLTRSGLDWTGKFGKEIIAAFKDLPVGTAIIDGELVVEPTAGASDFSALQADLSEGRSDRFVFYAFDLLHLDGYDLVSCPLVSRKELLRTIISSETGMLRFSSHFDENGDLLLSHACRLSLEGIVSKIANDPYRPGRGKTWVKSKCSSRQEFVIGGWVPSTTSRKAIGSLVLGVYEDGKLEHVGRVGTGYTHIVAEQLFKTLGRLKAEQNPFATKLTAEENRGVRFVRPELVAEVEFRAWTADGHLRHASFRGLREDKNPLEIVRETPKTATGASAEKPARSSVSLTHGDRLYWPDEGVTKAGLADYYTQVWRYMGPYVVGRPLALVRCPNGISGQHFFQKHAWKGMNRNIALAKDPQDEEPYVSINDLNGLIGLVQAAVLEVHPWGSMVGQWEKPDMIIMDLDPGPGVDWTEVIAAAEETGERLKQAGLVPFIKTSGGKGLHIVCPLVAKAEWPAVKAFTKGIADAMAADSPGRYVSTITKSKRRGKILIDYLRNQRGSTAVAPYSTRARPGAAVSMPLSWDELSPAIGPDYFTVLNVPTRLAALRSDPWADFRAAAEPLRQSQAKSKPGS